MTLSTVTHYSSAAPRHSAGPLPDIREVALSDLVLGDYRPRLRFVPEALGALARSIAAHGVLQPLLVRPLDTGPHGSDERSEVLRSETPRYEIVAGERRYLAARQLGLGRVPVQVRVLSDEAALETSLVENLQREDLGELEEAEGVLRLLSLRLGRDISAVKSLLYRMDNEAKRKVTQQVLGSPEARTVEDVFAVLGRLGWPSFVSTRLPLFSLGADVLEALRAGVISAASARLLGRVRDDAARGALIAPLWQTPLSEAELRRQVLLAVTPGPARTAARPVVASPRLGAWVTALLEERPWHSPARQERARALLAELAGLLSAEEADHDHITS